MSGFGEDASEGLTPERWVWRGVSPAISSGSISSMFRTARSPSALTWMLLIVISLETGDDSHRLQLLPGS